MSASKPFIGAYDLTILLPFLYLAFVLNHIVKFVVVKTLNDQNSYNFGQR